MDFTLEELNMLVQLLDIATKTGGLQIAQQTLPLAIKVQQIAQAKAAEAEEKTAE